MKIIDSIKRLKWYEALIWISSVILPIMSSPKSKFFAGLTDFYTS